MTVTLNRRELLQKTACGFGGLALSGMIADTAAAVNPLAAGIFP